MTANHHDKPNPTNSPVIQAVLDAITAAKEAKDDTMVSTLQASLTALQRNRRITYRADQIYNAHRYPDKAITYTKVATYATCPQRFALSHGAMLVYDLFTSIMSQDGLVRVPQSYICDILGIKRTTLRQNIAELCNYRFVAVANQPPKGSRTPVTYMIDRRISCIGVTPRDDDNNKFNAIANGINHKQLSPKAYQHEIITYRDEDNHVHRIGTIIPACQKEKEPASVTPPQTQAPLSKPINNNNNNTSTITRSNDDEYITIPPDIDFKFL